ncbi:15618_t:CDS:2, partial [Acaulospora colombiana]
FMPLSPYTTPAASHYRYHKTYSLWTSSGHWRKIDQKGSAKTSTCTSGKTVGLAGVVYGERGINLWQRQDADPCAAIANQTFAVPSKVLACFKVVFVDTDGVNSATQIADVISKSLNFHTSTNYQLSSTVFPDVQVDIQAELQRIKGSTYSSDSCRAKISYLPFPLVNLASGSQQTNQTIFIAPEAFEVASKEFAPFLDQWQGLAGFNFTKYSSAQVIAIDGLDPWIAVEENAKVIGSWQGRSQRENSFFSSYIRGGTGWTYRMGDFAARSLPPSNNTLSLTVIPANSTEPETINVPFISRITVPHFTDSLDFWNQNCVATFETNGADYYQSGVMAMQAGTVTRVDPSPPKFAEPIAPQDRKQLLSSFVDTTSFTNIDLPTRIAPSAPVA